MAAETLSLTRSGIFVPFTFLKNDERVLLEKYFTLKFQTILNTVQYARGFIRDEERKRYILPRYGLHTLLHHTPPKHAAAYQPLIDRCRQLTITSQIQPCVPMVTATSTKFRFECKLSPIQKLVIEEIKGKFFTAERFKEGQTGCIIDMPPGLGKSHTAAYFTSIYGATAVVIHSSVTLQQWKEVYRSCFPEFTDDDIGEYHSGKKRLGLVNFIIIKSAAKDSFKLRTAAGDRTMSALEFYKNFNLIIFDECHKYANNESRQVFRSAQAPYMLGLSGTPNNRADGFDKIVHWNIGPIFGYERFIKECPADDLPAQVTFIATVYKIEYAGSPVYTKYISNTGTGTFSSSSTITMVCEDPYRHEVVLDCIDDALSKNLYLFVFADRCEYLAVLMRAYNTRKERRQNAEAYAKGTEGAAIVSNDKEYMRVIGGASDAEMKTASEQAKVIFTTYQYMDTGKSIPRMTGIILATPRRSNIDQTIGRILRINSDTTARRHIYDIVDVNVKLANQWKSRAIVYKKANFDIETTLREYTTIAIA